MNRLEEIITYKKKEIEELKKKEDIKETTLKIHPRFGESLIGSSLGVVCEIKKKSPSAGNLNASADPVETAKTYEQSGASAISVLTDQHFFGGSFDFLKEIRQTVQVPLLCKDFILDPVQIRLAAQMGASAVLLITECLNDSLLLELYEYSRSLGMDALVEAHEPDNIRRAVDLGAPIIGINNRNLKTFEIDLEWGFQHIHLIPENRIRMSLSAYSTRKDAEKAASQGFDAILVGSALMKAKDISHAVRQFTDIPISNLNLNLQIQSKSDFYQAYFQQTHSK